MMSFEQYWKKLKARNPDLKAAVKLTITVESFKKQLLMAFEHGAAAGRSSLSEFEKIFRKDFGR